jgi:hypothetical protein
LRTSVHPLWSCLSFLFKTTFFDMPQL